MDDLFFGRNAVHAGPNGGSSPIKMLELLNSFTIFDTIKFGL